MNSVTVPFYISHQGCPHTCIFCDQRLISGSRGDLPGPAQITERVKRWEETARGRALEVAFFGGTFTSLEPIQQERLLDPLQPLLKTGRVREIRISTRPDAISSEHVRWLAERGVTTIELGVQSMDDGVLAISGRGHDAAAAETALRIVSSAGLNAVAQLMPGLPGDSDLLSLMSLQRVIAAGAGAVRLYPAVVFKGTGLAELFLSGSYLPPDRDSVIATCKMLLLEALKAKAKVLRIGLQSDGNDFSGAVLAGFWHPAMGDLVYSALFLDLISKLTVDCAAFDRMTVSCHPRRISNVIGHHRRNLEILQGSGVSVEKVVSDPALSEYELVVCYGGTVGRGSILDLASAPAEQLTGEP